MSYAVAVLVAFQPPSLSDMQDIAEPLLRELEQQVEAEYGKPHERSNPYGIRDALHFLVDLIDHPSVHTGTQGEMFTWGIVGNHVNAQLFIDSLNPFWSAVLPKMGWGSSINVFFQYESLNTSEVYRISWLDERDARMLRCEPGLQTVRHDGLPCGWWNGD